MYQNHFHKPETNFLKCNIFYSNKRPYCRGPGRSPTRSEEAPRPCRRTSSRQPRDTGALGPVCSRLPGPPRPGRTGKSPGASPGGQGGGDRRAARVPDGDPERERLLTPNPQPPAPPSLLGPHHEHCLGVWPRGKEGLVGCQEAVKAEQTETRHLHPASL